MKLFAHALSLLSVSLVCRAATLPGFQADGSVQLPNQWSLRPAGHQIAVGDLPSNVAIHPGGRFAAVLHCGYGPHELRLLDLESQRVVQEIPVGEAFYGLAWTADGAQLYASGAGLETIHSWRFKKRKASFARRLAGAACGGKGCHGRFRPFARR